MAFDFLKLPRSSQRAAFAHMSNTGKGKITAKAVTPKKKPGAARKKMAATKSSGATAPVLNPKPGGGFQQAGSISREDAARIMFGSKGAAKRMAKAKAKKRRNP